MRFRKRPSVRSWTSWTSCRALASVRLPMTALTTRRCSGARAMWSQQSPQRASAGPQCVRFLATKAHFSSSWTSWVEGGKGHEFVVAVLGVVAGPQGVADDGVLVHPRQAGRLAHAAAVLQVAEHVEGFGTGQAGAEKGAALAVGEAPLAA